MPRLTAAQVAQVCARAGFADSGLVAAVAVALAESGGNTQAVNVNTDATRSRDRGLFQINSRWHPEVTDAQAFDPAAAAGAAYRISNRGRDWSQWSAWKNGAYLVHVPAARMAAARVRVSVGAGSGASSALDPAPNPGPDILPNVPNPFDFGVPSPLDALDAWQEAVVAVAGPFIKAGAWIADPHNWVRVAFVTTGGMMVLAALTMIGKSGAAGAPVAAAANTAEDAAQTAASLAILRKP